MEYGQDFNPFRVFTGIFIPTAITRSWELSPGAKLVYGRLVQYAGEDGECFPAVDTIGREIGLGERQTRRYLSELEDFGLIRKIQRGSTSNLYRFRWHPIFEQPGVRSDRSDVSGPDRTDVSAEEDQFKENQLNTHTTPVRVSALRASELNGQTSQRWEEFWGKYPRKQRKDFAARNFVSYITVDTEAAVFACLDRYLRSAEVARGIVMNPDKWLYEQHNDGWAGEWPARPKTLDERIEELPDD